MEYEDENNSKSDSTLGAVTYSIMFAAYLLAITILALCGVNFIYFFAVLLAGFPVSGVYLSMLQGMRMRRENLARIQEEQKEPVRTKNDAGYDIIEL
jgi:small neutral amino acid transporter SnatA (MarC family)